MPSLDATSKQLAALASKAAADQRIGFFERRSLRKALGKAIEKATTPEQVDAYRDVVHREVGFSRWGGSDYPSSSDFRKLQKQAEEKKLELGAGAVVARIEALPVSGALKAAMSAIARNGVATPDQQDAVERAYLADLAGCSTPEAVGELYWSTFEVLKAYRRTGGGHDAWWCTGADQTMRSRSVARQETLDPRIRLDDYNDAPLRTVDWR
ncbi:MAG: hypothetical protein MUC96_17395 [Myxococcaceae bacterium]|jgi:hypothetical protein|nr:hypothetical protein [Myxococcaceae bacterium]